MKRDKELLLEAEEAIDLYYTKKDMASEIKDIFSIEEVERLKQIALTNQNRMSECLYVVLSLFVK